MNLKKPFWSEEMISPAPDKQPSSETKTVVGEMVNSLNKERLHREITLALQSGLRYSRAEFSFLRVRGLRTILKFMRSVTESDSTIQLFCHSQSNPEIQVIPVLFQNSLKESEDVIATSLDHIFSVEPKKITSPSIDDEVAFALRVLEGCC